jgi:hypothetical protein
VLDAYCFIVITHIIEHLSLLRPVKRVPVYVTLVGLFIGGFVRLTFSLARLVVYFILILKDKYLN